MTYIQKVSKQKKLLYMALGVVLVILAINIFYIMYIYEMFGQYFQYNWQQIPIVSMIYTSIIILVYFQTNGISFKQDQSFFQNIKQQFIHNDPIHLMYNVFTLQFFVCLEQIYYQDQKKIPQLKKIPHERKILELGFSTMIGILFGAFISKVFQINGINAYGFSTCCMFFNQFMLYHVFQTNMNKAQKISIFLYPIFICISEISIHSMQNQDIFSGIGHLAGCIGGCVYGYIRYKALIV